jgi:hypothetical protein
MCLRIQPVTPHHALRMYPQFARFEPASSAFGIASPILAGLNQFLKRMLPNALTTTLVFLPIPIWVFSDIDILYGNLDT